MADATSPSSVPATPKREVRTVAAGEAIPTARILGKSIMFAFCGSSLKESSSMYIRLHSIATQRGCYYFDYDQEQRNRQEVRRGTPLPLFTELPTRRVLGNP